MYKKYILLVLFISSFSFADVIASNLPTINDLKFSAEVKELGTKAKIDDYKINVDKVSSSFRWEEGDYYPRLFVKLKVRIPIEYKLIKILEKEIKPEGDGSFWLDIELKEKIVKYYFESYNKSGDGVAVDFKIKLNLESTIFNVHKSCINYKFKLEELEKTETFIVNIRCEEAPVKDKIYFNILINDSEFMVFRNSRIDKEDNGGYRLITTKYSIKAKWESLNFSSYDNEKKTGRFLLQYGGLNIDVGIDKRDFNLGFGLIYNTGNAKFDGSKSIASPGLEIFFESFITPGFAISGRHSRAFILGTGRFKKEFLNHSSFLFSFYPFAESGEKEQAENKFERSTAKFVKLINFSFGLGLVDLLGTKDDRDIRRYVTALSIPLSIGTQLYEFTNKESIKFELGYVPSFGADVSINQFPVKVFLQKKF